VSGGGGASLYQVEPQSFSAYAESTHHTVFVTLDGCTLTLQAIKPDGTIFDTSTLTKPCVHPNPEPTTDPFPTIELMWPLYLPVVWKVF
jgi:hypothetical protein